MTRNAGLSRILLPAALLAVAAAAPARAQSAGLPLPPTPPPAGEMPHAMPGPSIDPLAIPQLPPPPPVLPPPIVVPVRPDRPPPPATVAADAPGAATAIPGGLQLTFGPGRAELNQATYAALQSLIAAARPGADFSVRAFAAGDPADPSVARRLSLSRALAVRSVLIHGGIASPQITVLALGAAPPGPAPDRVDVTETEPK